MEQTPDVCNRMRKGCSRLSYLQFARTIKEGKRPNRWSTICTVQLYPFVVYDVGLSIKLDFGVCT